MFLIVYVYVIAFVLNVINLYKSYKGSNYYSLFFIFKNLVFIFLFNYLFNYLVKIFNITFVDIKKMVVIFIISILLYLKKRKYICLSFSSGLFYIICLLLNISINFKEVVFLVGVLHIFEAMFLILNFILNMKLSNDLNEKLYLPLILGSIPIIFMIFYGRKNKENEYKKIVSGVVIFLYGIIILLVSILNNDVLSLVLMISLHELILFVENFIIKKIELISN